uniref:Uncharacterized protein n=1 Tax=Stomoxys calcitrans TaxID=35570 RepID=A0A1I8PVX2_STOCA
MHLLELCSPLMSAICVRVMTYPWMWLFMKNPSQGAQCAIRLATDPKLKQVTGEFFNDCEVAASSPLGQDKELAKKLYQQTMQTLRKVTKLQIDKEELEAADVVNAALPTSAEKTKAPPSPTISDASSETASSDEQ